MPIGVTPRPFTIALVAASAERTPARPARGSHIAHGVYIRTPPRRVDPVKVLLVSLVVLSFLLLLFSLHAVLVAAGAAPVDYRLLDFLTTLMAMVLLPLTITLAAVLGIATLFRKVKV